MYITTPIYYVNGSPHIGSCYTNFACDTLARFHRLWGEKVFFLTGTDEHGQKIERAAGEESPKIFVDRVSGEFRDVFDQLGISYNYFIRTTEARHYDAVAHLWNAIKDYIYLGSYSGYYSVQDEAFYDESEIIDGKAPSGSTVEWVVEPSYFFKLSAFQERLLSFYNDHPEFIQPESRRNEVIRFVEGGLQDLSISRTNFSWGIPVPNDPKHVIYVWLDALTNYITALGYPDQENENFKKFWPTATHIIGKDILRFHAVYWPAFLMAANLPLPHKIFAHGWWTNEGEKMSKSKGNVINPLEMVNKYGVDALRYYLLREVPFGNDGDFSEKALVQRYNSDLANSIGNLVQRVFSFVYKYFDGKVPENVTLEAKDYDFFKRFSNAYIDMQISLEKKCDLHRYAKWIAALASVSNQYIDQEKPWVLRTTDEARFKAVIYALLEGIKRLAIMGWPLLPIAMRKILNAMHSAPIELELMSYIPSGRAIEALEPLFPRLDN